MDVQKKIMVKKVKEGEKVSLTVRLDAAEYRQLMDTMYKLKQRKFQTFITRLINAASKNPEKFNIESDY